MDLAVEYRDSAKTVRCSIQPRSVWVQRFAHPGSELYRPISDAQTNGRKNKARRGMAGNGEVDTCSKEAQESGKTLLTQHRKECLSAPMWQPCVSVSSARPSSSL